MGQGSEVGVEEIMTGQSINTLRDYHLHLFFVLFIYSFIRISE